MRVCPHSPREPVVRWRPLFAPSFRCPHPPSQEDFGLWSHIPHTMCTLVSTHVLLQCGDDPKHRILSTLTFGALPSCCSAPFGAARTCAASLRGLRCRCRACCTGCSAGWACCSCFDFGYASAVPAPCQTRPRNPRSSDRCSAVCGMFKRVSTSSTVQWQRANNLWETRQAATPVVAVLCCAVCILV